MAYLAENDDRLRKLIDDAARAAIAPPPPQALKGVWVVYYSDDSSFVPFDQEILALRHAVENSMRVKFVKYGERA